MSKIQEYTHMGAKVSDDGRYRFKLWRIWNDRLPKVLFIMHNPSTADGMEDDPTIRRCVAFAQAWGYGGIYVGNLHPGRATNPKDLWPLPNEVRATNQMHCNEMLSGCNIVVWAHGKTSRHVWVSDVFFKGVPGYYLRLTKDGTPGHPLFLPKNLFPKPFGK